MSGWLERFGFALGRALRTFRSTASVAAPSPAKSIESGPPPESSNLGVFALSDAEMAERKISAITIGELELPTGEIVACDPLITGLSRPAFSRKVKPGRYPVTLLQAQGCIAAAVLRFGPGLPTCWELATFVPDRPPVYKSEFLEFIVDDAVASFMDKSVLTLMTDPEQLDDYLADVACAIDRFCINRPIEGNPINVAMFDTGYGDGSYRSFWGLDAAGEPLLLVTDFEVLETRMVEKTIRPPMANEIPPMTRPVVLRITNGWLETFRLRLGQAARGMRWIFRQSIVVVGLSAAVPSLAVAAEWDPATASSNFGIFALNDAQLAERKITVTPIGQLELPTGEIIACDPLITSDDWPALARRVKPGHYPVTLFETQGRVAAAFLRFRSGVPVRWELATLPGQDVSTLNGDEIFGYPVDAGLGSFMDKAAMALMSAAQDKLKPDQNYYDDVLAAEFAPNKDRFVMHHPDAGNPVNIAMFWSGWGDGFYPSFWGLDAGGEPVVLMTDFGVLENADGREGGQAK